MGRYLARALGVVALAALAGPRCAEEFEFRGVLGRAMPVAREGALPLAPALVLDRPLVVALDPGAPVTTLALGGDAGAATVVDLRVLEAPAPGQVASIARMLFPSLDVYDAPTGSIVLGAGAPTPVDGVVGADVLEHFAVEFELFDAAGPRVTFFDERPGSSSQLACDGLSVFDYAPQGGGDLGGSSCTSDLPARRIILSSCIRDAGGGEADFALAVSLAAAPVVLSRSGAARLWPGGVDCEAGDLWLPGGAVAGACRAEVASVAVVSDEDEERGPCAERGGPRSEEVARAAYAAASAPDLWIVPDVAVAAVRVEVGADEPTVDGLLGAEFLGRFRFWADYPASRITLECPCRALDPGCGCADQVRIAAGRNEPDCP